MSRLVAAERYQILYLKRCKSVAKNWWDARSRFPPGSSLWGAGKGVRYAAKLVTGTVCLGSSPRKAKGDGSPPMQQRRAGSRHRGGLGSDHDKEHLEATDRLQGVGAVGRHDNHLTGAVLLMCISGEAR